MPVLELADLTWGEVAELERARVVALLPLGAVEAHGPHLPVVTDGIIAESMARAAALRLEQRSLVPLLLPPLSYTAAPFAADFPGTVSVRAETVASLLAEIADSLAAWEVPLLALANAHLDPAHLAAVHAAVAAIRARARIRVAFPDLTRRPWGSRLTAEFKSGACHAGRFEGSIVLAARPEAVRREVAERLAPNPISLSQAIGQGRKDFVTAGGPQAYFGDPAAATAEEGRETIEILGRILEEAVLEELEGDET